MSRTLITFRLGSGRFTLRWLDRRERLDRAAEKELVRRWDAQWRATFAKTERAVVEALVQVRLDDARRARGAE